MAAPRTLFDKIWDSHLIDRAAATAPACIYIDRHLVHEVTSPQAFEGLRLAGRKVRRPDATIAVADHNVPTTATARRGIDRSPNRDSRSRPSSATCKEFGVPYFGMDDIRPGHRPHHRSRAGLDASPA